MPAAPALSTTDAAAVDAALHEGAAADDRAPPDALIPETQIHDSESNLQTSPHLAFTRTPSLGLPITPEDTATHTTPLPATQSADTHNQLTPSTAASATPKSAQSARDWVNRVNAVLPPDMPASAAAADLRDRFNDGQVSTPPPRTAASAPPPSHKKYLEHSQKHERYKERIEQGMTPVQAMEAEIADQTVPPSAPGRPKANKSRRSSAGVGPSQQNVLDFDHLDTIGESDTEEGEAKDDGEVKGSGLAGGGRFAGSKRLRGGAFPERNIVADRTDAIMRRVIARGGGGQPQLTWKSGPLPTMARKAPEPANARYV